MHINLESDYAVRIVHGLSDEHRLEAQAIAAENGLPLPITLKIMRKLAAADVVKSFKGAHGGYMLARPPEGISLRQVIEAVEGPYRFSRCVGSGYDCGSAGGCPFLSVFDDITRLVVDKLEKTTFDMF